jgi:hypothetical protein
MEATKSIIWNRGEKTIDGKKVYTYLIGTILVTDKPIDGLKEIDNISMGNTNYNPLSDAFSNTIKYKSPHNLGDLSNAMIDISSMTPEDLEPQ